MEPLPKWMVAPDVELAGNDSPTRSHFKVMENGYVAENDEKPGDFLNFSEDLVQLPNIKSAGTSEVDFDGLLSEPLKLYEDLKGGCGGQLWAAGMVLAKYMLRRHRTSLEGKTMLVGVINWHSNEG